MSEQINLPDGRDGLTQEQRITLYCLHQLQAELKKEFVPTLMLYGRVSEYLNLSQAEFQHILLSL